MIPDGSFDPDLPKVMTSCAQTNMDAVSYEEASSSSIKRDSTKKSPDLRKTILQI